MKILIDDFRHYLPDGSTPDFIARNYAAGVVLLAHMERWAGYPQIELYLDHDLGGGDNATGYRIISDLEEDHELNGTPLPAKIVCVSDNGPGRYRIQQVIDKLYKERV